MVYLSEINANVTAKMFHTEIIIFNRFNVCRICIYEIKVN